jgi:hypothetical protein
VIQSLLPRRVRRFSADCSLRGQYGLTIGLQKFSSLELLPANGRNENNPLNAVLQRFVVDALRVAKLFDETQKFSSAASTDGRLFLCLASVCRKGGS